MFVERTAKDGEEVVVLLYAAAFYWFMWPTLGITVLTGIRSSTALNVAARVLWILLLAVAVPHWPVIWQLKKQMHESSITASGLAVSISARSLKISGFQLLPPSKPRTQFASSLASFGTSGWL